MESEGVKLLKQRWKDLKPETQSAKSRMGFGNKKILERTGKLKKGIKTVQINNSQVTVSNRVKYYPYHQIGGKKIPQREMLGVNDDVAEIVMKELVKAIKF
jgi:phage gpG-like protein